MRKINKLSNIAVISMLIWGVFCKDFAYAYNIPKLRIPLNSVSAGRFDEALHNIAKPNLASDETGNNWFAGEWWRTMPFEYLYYSPGYLQVYYEKLTQEMPEDTETFESTKGFKVILHATKKLPSDLITPIKDLLLQYSYEKTGISKVYKILNTCSLTTAGGESFMLVTLGSKSLDRIGYWQELQSEELKIVEEILLLVDPEKKVVISALNIRFEYIDTPQKIRSLRISGLGQADCPVNSSLVIHKDYRNRWFGSTIIALGIKRSCEILGGNSNGLIGEDMDMGGQSPPLEKMLDKMGFSHKHLFGHGGKGVSVKELKANEIFQSLFAKNLRKDRLLSDTLDYEAMLKFDIPTAQSKIKCIVVDCDGVLWGGVIGEDGVEGIELGEDGNGKHFLNFQKKLLALKDRGFMLAINSKNNRRDIEGVLEMHPCMVLKKQDFAVIRANWEDKAANLEEIARELNIGLDSILFLDDSSRERELVRQIHPEVSTPDFPLAPVLYASFIQRLDVLQKDIVTHEDRRRAEMYANRREREMLRAKSATLESFYRSLEMKAVIRIGDENLGSIPRISQLTQRTNQFSLTTKRYNERDIESFLENNDYRVYTLELSDKFGYDGIVGLMILRRIDDSFYKIDAFCLSCRVVRLTVEDAFVAWVVKDLKAAGVQKIRGIYIATERNALVKYLYHRFGFKKDSLDGEPGKDISTLNIIQSDLQIPDWITINKGDERNTPWNVLQDTRSQL